MLDSVDEILDKLDEFQAKISEVDAQLDELEDRQITLDIFIENEDKLDELKLFLDDIESHIYEIEIHINADDALAKVEEIRLDLDELTDHAHEIDINVNDADLADAAVKVEALKAEIDSLNDSEKKASDSSGGFEFSIGMLAPLLIPASAAVMSLVGGVGALAAVFGTMVAPVALAGYATDKLYTSVSTLYSGLSAATQAALMNATTLSQTASILEKNSTAYDHMSKSMQQVVVGYVTLKQVVSQFESDIKPETIQLLFNLFELLSTSLSLLIDPAMQAAGAIAGLIADFTDRLNDPTFQTFFNNMDANIGTLVTDWGTGVINIIEGITAIINAFLPMGLKMSGGFVTMTQEFDTWAQHLGDSPGFNKFVTTVETDGPMILKILGNIISIIGKLVVDMGESNVNVSIFSTLLGLLQKINSVASSHPALTQLFADLTLVGIAAWKLGPALGPLMEFIATPTGAIVAAILGIGVAFTIAYNKSATFRAWVATNLLPLFDQVSTKAIQMKNWLISIWPEIQEVWDKYGKNILGIVVAYFTLIAKTIENVMTVIEGIINVILGVLTGNWSQVWKGIKEIFSGVWNEIIALAMAFLTVLGNQLEMGWKLISSMFSSALKGLENNFSTNLNTILSWFKALPGELLDALGDMGDLLLKAGEDVITGFINGLENKIPGLKSLLNDITSWLPSWKGPPATDAKILEGSGELVMQGFLNGLQSKYGAVKTSLAGLTNNLGNNISKQISTDITAKINSGLQSSSASVSGALPKGTPGASGAGSAPTQVTFAAGAIQINNPSQENPGTSLTRAMQAVSRFGTIQMPSGMAATG